MSDVVYRAPFAHGTHVVIKPLERMKGRVITQEYDQEGWTISVRYIDEGEAKTMKCFLDEVELEDRQAEESRRQCYEAAARKQPSAGIWPPDSILLVEPL